RAAHLPLAEKESRMSMADFGAALAGGAPPPGGPPPDLGPPPDAGAPPPPDEAPPETGAGQFENSLEALDVAEEALHAFIQLDPDEADRAQAAQALQQV